MVENSSNQSELEKLKAFLKERRDSRELKRGLAVKLSLEKYSYHQIQSIVDVSIGFISKWKKAFLAQGVEGLTLGYKGAKPCLNQEEKYLLKRLKEKYLVFPRSINMDNYNSFICLKLPIILDLIYLNYQLIKIV